MKNRISTVLSVKVLQTRKRKSVFKKQCIDKDSQKRMKHIPGFHSHAFHSLKYIPTSLVCLIQQPSPGSHLILMNLILLVDKLHIKG